MAASLWPTSLKSFVAVITTKLQWIREIEFWNWCQVNFTIRSSCVNQNLLTTRMLKWWRWVEIVVQTKWNRKKKNQPLSKTLSHRKLYRWLLATHRFHCCAPWLVRAYISLHQAFWSNVIPNDLILTLNLRDLCLNKNQICFCCRTQWMNLNVVGTELLGKSKRSKKIWWLELLLLIRMTDENSLTFHKRTFNSNLCMLVITSLTNRINGISIFFS